MKKSIYMFLFTLMTIVAAVGCREKTTGEKIEDGIEEVGDGLEEGAEEIKDGIEDGAEEIKDKVEDVTDDN